MLRTASPGPGTNRGGRLLGNRPVPNAGEDDQRRAAEPLPTQFPLVAPRLPSNGTFQASHIPLTGPPSDDSATRGTRRAVNYRMGTPIDEARGKQASSSRDRQISLDTHRTGAHRDDQLAVTSPRLEKIVIGVGP